MRRIINTALSVIMACGLSACESKLDTENVKLLPEIIDQNFKKSEVEIPEEILEPGQAPTYYVSKAEGIYIYNKPDTKALKIQTLYSGDSFVGERINDEWVRMTLRIYVEKDYSFVVGYVKLQDISTKWQDTPLTNTLMNQIIFMYYEEGQEPIYTPKEKRFFELDGYAYIELIDKETYEVAARERIDQFVADTITHRKQNGKIIIPSKQKPYTIEDIGTDTDDYSFAESTYLGRTAPDGDYVIHTMHYEGQTYHLVNPTTGKLEVGYLPIPSYPLLSPKQDYIISVAEHTYDEATNIIILKANANKEYEIHSNFLCPFWQPYEDHHNPQDLEEEYSAPTAKDFLPNGSQFWSRDNHFYLRVRPYGFKHKDPLEADPRAYYARIKILPAKASKPSVAKS